MPYAYNQGVRIYYEVEGEGPPLVLVHGLGSSLAFWRITGYSQALADDYRLILVDPRGHGASDKPHDPEAYRMALRVGDVVSVLDQLGIERASFCGYSMGAWTGWNVEKYAPSRFSSLIIGGASYFADWAAVPDLLQLFREGGEAVLAAFEQFFGLRWTPDVSAMFAANDLEALVALLSVQEPVDVDKHLAAITLPCLLYGGQADPFYAGAAECAARLANATVVTLPGLDHPEAQYRPDLVVPHIRSFLAQVGED